MQAMILRTWKTWRLLRSRKADVGGLLMMFLGVACAIVSAFDFDILSMLACIIGKVYDDCALRIALILLNILASSPCSK